MNPKPQWAKSGLNFYKFVCNHVRIGCHKACLDCVCWGMWREFIVDLNVNNLAYVRLNLDYYRSTIYAF